MRIELSLTQRCGAVLADVLQGKIEPLTLLFPNDPQLLVQLQSLSKITGCTMAKYLVIAIPKNAA